MRITLIISFWVVLLLSACEFDDSALQYDLGDDFVEDPARVFMIDTLTVNTYTTAIDSFTTSRSRRFLAGISTNKYGIETYCETYFRIGEGDSYGFHKSAKFDSASFILHLDGYNFGDTSQVNEFEIYRMTEELVVDEKIGYIFNNQQFDVESAPIGRFTVDLSKEVDSIRVPLSDLLGKELFDLCVNDPDKIIEEGLFNDYFKGISIKPVRNKSNYVIGISAVPDSTTAPRIRLYYHDISLNDNLYLDFPLEIVGSESGEISTELENYYSCNFIQNNYSGTVLESLTPGEGRISSDLTNNYSFLQAGITLRTRIEIPAVDDLKLMGIGSIIKAELLFEPEENTYTNKTDLPSSLQMILVNRKNEYFSPLYVVGSTSSPAIGNLIFNAEFKKKTYYSYDISSYLKDEYDSQANPEYALMMYLPSDSKYPTVDMLMIGNQKSENNKMKLKVYITNYK